MVTPAPPPRNHPSVLVVVDTRQRGSWNVCQMSPGWLLNLYSCAGGVLSLSDFRWADSIRLWTFSSSLFSYFRWADRINFKLFVRRESFNPNILAHQLLTFQRRKWCCEESYPTFIAKRKNAPQLGLTYSTQPISSRFESDPHKGSHII